MVLVPGAAMSDGHRWTRTSYTRVVARATLSVIQAAPMQDQVLGKPTNEVMTH